MEWYVYLLKTKCQRLYCGITKNVEKRVKAHNEGKGAKWTQPASRRPLVLVLASKAMTHSEALKLEYRIKQFVTQDKKISYLKSFQ